jgi:hypothetical protein
MLRQNPMTLFCLPCERPVQCDPMQDNSEVSCPDCGGALVEPHPDACVKCGGTRTPDGLLCLGCGRIEDDAAHGGPAARSGAKRLLTHLVAFGLGVALGWKVLTAIQTGLFTRGRLRHDILGSEEPIWFWVNVCLTGLGAALLVLGSIWSYRGGGKASISFGAGR